MDFSKYSVVEEYDTALGDSFLYYSMTENEETFVEKTTENVQTVVKRRPSDGTPTQVANKSILQKLKDLSLSSIPEIRVTKCEEFEELDVDFLKENEDYEKNENLSDDEKCKSWVCSANKDEIVKNVKKFPDGKNPEQNVKFKDPENFSEVDEDDKTIQNESLINNLLVNTTEDPVTDNVDKENKPDVNVPILEAKEKKKRRESQIPMQIKITKNPQLQKTSSSARKTIYSFGLRKVPLTGQSTSRKSFLGPNIIAASRKPRRRSLAKPSYTCEYCFKEFEIAKALNNHLLENCLKIPPAEKRRRAIENIKKINASKNST